MRREGGSLKKEKKFILENQRVKLDSKIEGGKIQKKERGRSSKRAE